MKIVIGNQYQNDEDNNERYNIDENGNVNLFIDIDNDTENNSVKNEGISINNINNLQSDKIIQNDFIELNDEIGPEEINQYINLENDEDIKYQYKEEKDIEYNQYTEKKDIEYNQYTEKKDMEYNQYPEEKDIEYNQYPQEKNIEYNQYQKENLIIEEIDNEKSNNTITVENKLGDKFKDFYENIYSERENDLEEKYTIVNEKIIEEKIVEENQYNNINRNENIFNEKIETVKTGEINILCKLGGKDGVELKGARVNLYLLNGISPKLCDSKFTDGSGRITFSNLQNGCYRIISIVDRRYFEKPSYYNWNEVTIDKNTKKANIVIVNKLKSGYYRRQY